MSRESPTPSSPSAGRRARPGARQDLGVVVGDGATRAGSRDPCLVTQDLRLQPFELRAGLDAQLLDERRAGS